MRSRKLTGTDSRLVTTAVKASDTYCGLLKMGPRGMARLFVVAFDGDVRDFYSKQIRPQMTYEQKKTTMESHYNSQARRLQILTSLESLDFSTFKKRNNIEDEQRAPTKFVEFINTNTKELNNRHDNDSARLGHLRPATKHMSWASAPLRNFSTAKYSYL